MFQGVVLVEIKGIEDYLKYILLHIRNKELNETIVEELRTVMYALKDSYMEKYDIDESKAEKMVIKDMGLPFVLCFKLNMKYSVKKVKVGEEALKFSLKVPSVISPGKKDFSYIVLNGNYLEDKHLFVNQMAKPLAEKWGLPVWTPLLFPLTLGALIFFVFLYEFYTH